MKEPKKKILIADNSPELLRFFKQHKDAKKFEIEIATKGLECLEKLKTFKPDLVITEFMLPEVHGIQILKEAKHSPLMKKTGVIMTCYHILLQNYSAAVHLGADYVLEKPFSIEKLFELADLFFEGKLHIQPLPKEKKQKKKKAVIKEINEPPRYLKFWGTRGSNPVAGPEYVRFGGNTSCLEIRNGEDLIIIDAGSGIRPLGQELHTHKGSKLHILLSHTHWDHLLGFPFFSPIHQADREIHIWAPVGFEKTTKVLFEEMLNYAYFPVAFEDVKSKIFFHDLKDSHELNFGGISLYTHYAFHPGPTLCFKIKIGEKKFGYITDNEFLINCTLPPEEIEKHQELFEPYLSMIAFFKDCDLLIHEAQYTCKEYEECIGWGHSSVYNAAFLLKKTGIKHWIVVHHDPKHTDEFLLAKLQTHINALNEIDHECQVQFAYDGMMLPL